jgi:ISXO2-like transposase domain
VAAIVEQKSGDACTNQAESFFSRLRRAEIGTHHRIMLIGMLATPRA